MSTSLGTTGMAAWRAFQWANAVIMKRLEQDLGEHGLSLAEFDVLIHLYEAERGRLSLQGLIEAMVLGGSLSRSGVTRLLDRMERDGLVTRELNRGDRRRFDVEIADKGRALFRRVWPGRERGIVKHFVSLMSKGEIIRLHRTLTKLIDSNETAM